MANKTVLEKFTSFMDDMVEEFGVEDCVTEIKIHPSIYHKMLEERSLEALGNNITFYHQSGEITIKKDLTSIINYKQDNVNRLLKEIEVLKNES
jgi:hypothetical protein